MLNVTDAYKQAILSDQREFCLRVYINDNLYETADIQQMSWSGGSITGDSFLIGSTVAADIKITFSHIVEGIAEEQEFSVEVGLVLPDKTVEYVPLGVFIITDFDQKRNDNQTTIDGMDRFVYMDGPYESTLSYPASIKDVAVEIANKSGVMVNVASFEQLPTNQVQKPENYTCRQAIGLIAQFMAGYACFNRYGELEIKQLIDPEYELKPTNYFSKGLDKNEVTYRIYGIQVEVGDDTVLTVGTSKGSQIFLANKLMYQQLLDNIFQKLKNINYYPFSLNWQGDPALEPGDWITIVDLKNNKFKVPNLDYNLTFNGGLSATSSANQKSVSQNSNQVRGNLNQIISDIKGRVSASGGNWTFDGLDTPKNPKEGDLWYKPNGPDIELWRYEKNSDGFLDWAFIMSTAGITEAKNIAEDAKEAAEEATNTANNAVDDAQTALGEANFAKQQVDLINTIAQNALDNAQSSLSFAQDAWDKAIGLEGEVTTISAQVQINTDSIALKADQTVVDTINGSVSSLSSQVEVLIGQISLKADQSYVTGFFEWHRSTEPDLDLYTTRGNYYIRVAELVHAPTSGYAYLKVDPIEAGRIQQTFQKDNDPRGYYTRVTTNSSGSWGEWRYYADGKDILGLQDNITQVSSNLTVEAGKISLISTEVSEQGTLISALQQTTTGLTSYVTDLQNGYSMLTQTINGLQLEVAGKADLAQLTILENLFTVTVTNNRNMIPYWEMGTLSTSQGTPADSEAYYRTPYIKVKSETDYFIGNETGANGPGAVFQYDKNHGFLGVASVDHGKFQTAEQVQFIRIRNASNIAATVEEVKLTLAEGSIGIPWSPVSAQSQLTQFAEGMNLRVEKGEIIGQLNIEAGQTLIQQTGVDGRIILDAATVVFTGNAFIPGAYITNVIADTITVGTLNAATVRIINLDAANISVGYLNTDRIQAQSITADKLETNAIAIGFNSYTNTMKLTPTSLEFYSNNVLSSKLTSEGQEFWNGTKRIGSIGETAFVDNPNLRGVRLGLTNDGRYLAFSYQDSPTASGYTPALLLDPFGQVFGSKGLYVRDLDLYLNNANYIYANHFRTSGYTDTKGIELKPISIDGNGAVAIVNQNNSSGIALGDYGKVWIKHDGGWVAFG